MQRRKSAANSFNMVRAACAYRRHERAHCNGWSENHEE